MKASKKDPINPEHYRFCSDGNEIKLEVFDAIEILGLHRDACLCAAVQYIVRAGKKADSDLVTDLRKAIWYIDRRIQQELRQEPWRRRYAKQEQAQARAQEQKKA